MRVMFLGLAVLALGCGDDSSEPDAGSSDAGMADAGPRGRDAGVPDAGPTCTTDKWRPGTGTLSRWPEPDLVVDDPSTATGARLVVEPERWRPTLDMAAGFAAVLTDDLRDLDGFGVNAESYFMFDRAFDESRLPNAEETLVADAGVGIAVLPDDGAPYLHPVLVSTLDEGQTLLLAPMRPLPEQTRAVAFVTRALTDAARGCLEPSPALAERLDAPDVAAAIAALTTLGVVDGEEDVVAVTPFSTQTITADSIAVAADIAARDYDVDAPPTCVTEERWILCDGTFTSFDYREPADGAIHRAPGAAAEPTGSYRVPFSVWLPLEGERPFPTMLFGHGLGSGREQAQRLAEFAAPEGIATIAVPALQHGEHPTVPEGAATTTIATVLRFFTIGDLSERGVEALRLRDHFRQSTYDRLQLTRLLEDGMDVDGDGAVDLDPTRLGYLGVSLGGIMGPELLALTSSYDVAVLVVPGGRVSTIVSDSALIGSFLVLLAPRGTTESDIRRFIATFQGILDRGDAASYGPHVVERRLSPGTPPSVLVGVVLDDDTVPNVSNYVLVRALGTPLVPPLLRAEPGLVLSDPPPVSGNVADGAATYGMLQFDVIRERGEVRTATHSNIGDSEVGARAWFDFLRTHWDEGLARIEDPYEATGLPHGLPEP